VQNAHLGQVDAEWNSTENMSCHSVSDDDDVEPDDVRSETSVDGLPPANVTASSLNSADLLSMQRENWVTAVAALHNTDLVVSGKKCFCLIFVFSY